MVSVNNKTPRKRRIRRVRPLDNNSIGTHFWNLLVISIISLIAVSYILVQRHEEKAAAATAKYQESEVQRILHERKPFLIYGTAWKQDETSRYVAEAVLEGFRFIGTAAQPKHYNERGVGEGWKQAAEELNLRRNDLFLQTIYSPYQGEDNIANDQHKLPYDPKAPIEEQVRQSVASSLKNLQTDYLDALILHSPMKTIQETFQVWSIFEKLVQDGVVKNIGISNCYDLNTFQRLYNESTIKPFALQNRFYAESNFDTDLRQFCKLHNIWYQSFWTLTANRKALQSVQAQALARRMNLTTNTLMFVFLMSLGYVTPFSGTKDVEHMKQDIEVMERIQNGEVFFESEQDFKFMANILGMPDLLLKTNTNNI